MAFMAWSIEGETERVGLTATPTSAVGIIDRAISERPSGAGKRLI